MSASRRQPTISPAPDRPRRCRPHPRLRHRGRDAATALSRAERGVTRAVVNADLLPTASFVIDPDIDFELGAMRDALNGAVTPDHLDVLDATGLATALIGDSIATNAFMLGFAFQRGAIPLSLEAIQKAIELNGAAIEMNRTAFAWGRLAAHDLPRVVSAARFKSSGLCLRRRRWRRPSPSAPIP